MWGKSETPWGAEKMQPAHVRRFQLQPYTAFPAFGFFRVEGEKRDR